MKSPDWDKLEPVFRMCLELSVSFSLNWSDSEELWYFTIHSASQSENFIGKADSFDGAIEAVTTWLSKCCK